MVQGRRMFDAFLIQLHPKSAPWEELNHSAPSHRGSPRFGALCKHKHMHNMPMPMPMPMV